MYTDNNTTTSCAIKRGVASHPPTFQPHSFFVHNPTKKKRKKIEYNSKMTRVGFEPTHISVVEI